MIAWTVARANGDTRSFEAWGIRSAIDRRISLGRGSVDLGFGRADLLGSLPFDRDETIVILADGAPYFRGRVIGEARGAYGSAEGATVTLADPWWYLEKLIFCRLIKVMSDANQNPVASNPSTGLQLGDFGRVSKMSSDFIFGNNATGALLDTRGMIVEAVNYAISKGAPIQLGTVDDGIQMPVEYVHDLTCAEVILKAIRWTPDQMSFWDFSVDPPALNIRTRANRPLFELDLSDETTKRVDVTPRYDLVLSGVTLNYLRKHQRENFETTTIDPDQAGPDPLGFGALVTTIELEGSYVYQAPAGDGGSLPPSVLIPQEPAPVGLAASLYNAFKDVGFDGAAAFLADDPSVLFLSKTLRVLNGAPAWAAATMDIQQVAIDLFALDDDDGEHYSVELTVGPPRHLGLTDLVGLTRKGHTNKPPLLDQPTNNPDNGGGGPRLPQWNYGNPQVPSATQRPDVVLKYYYGQNVGFPNAWGGFDGERALIHQTFISDPVLEEVYSGAINDQQIHVVRGIRFLVQRVYVGSSGTMPSFPVYVDVRIDDYYDAAGHRK